MRRAAPVVLALLAGSAVPSPAQPVSGKDLPPVLRPWEAWVREQIPDRACTAVHGSAVCVWPGRLELRLDARGGTFALQASADRGADLRLPGDEAHWPADVRLDGRPAPVLEREDGPTLRVEPGAHRVEGRFAWTHLPDSLAVPPSLGLVDLSVEGRGVALPRRDEAGLVWLRAEGESAATAESLRLQAFRRVADGIPLWVETRLSLEVSGKAREIELGGVLVPGAVPVAVSGDLPARVDESGRLRVQVRPGTFSVSVLARLDGRPDAVARPDAPPPWPAREVWVFAADERLRQVELSGLQPLDPSRTELPAEWRTLPAFLAEPGARLKLAEVRRGEALAPPDRIQLAREMWLDLGGGAFTVRDRFTGALARTWRLDVAKPAELGRVSVDEAEQLITAHPATQAPGVELRKGALAMEADSRLPRTGRLPAVGWTADVETLAATLHLPPGWSLLAATGADAAAGAWTARWNLLAFFFVLIVALAVGRLFGRAWGLVALAAVVLSYDEPGAPFVVWLSLLGATALGAVAPEGRLRTAGRVWRALSLLALLVILVPFVRDQVLSALYPQVAAGQGTLAELAEDLSGMGAAKRAAPAGVAPVPMAAPPAEAGPSRQAPTMRNAPAAQRPLSTEEADKLKALGDAATRKVESKAEETRQQVSSLNVALEQDPHAVIQTGPGVPRWSWRTFEIRWTGPVKQDQGLRLWLLSPGMNRALTFVRLVLVLLLAVRLWLDGSRLAAPRGAPAAAALALLLLASFGRPASAQDAIPDGDLLEELKTRLDRREPCQPDCLATAVLHVRLAGDTLTFAAEVHAADDAAWPLPGPPASWAPAVVRVDGQATGALARLDDGFLYVRLAKGVHRVEAVGPVPRADTLTVQLSDRPRRADADTPGWDVSGVRADGPPDASIQLSRKLRAGERAREEGGGYAPWLEVTRTLSLGLTWRVRTDVHRVSPPGAPVALRVPLLPGEQPTEADLETQDGVALVALGRDQTDAGWSSTLPATEALALKAPAGQPWSEVWRLECGVIWECEAQGLPPVAHQREGMLAPEFRPWPGEGLALRFRHPQAVAGQAVTLQSVRVDTTPGDRLTTTELTLATRASRDAPLVLALPAEAEVQEVTVGGSPRPARPDQGRLRVTVPAGTQTVVVRWREPHGMGLYRRAPAVGLPVPAVNVETVLHVPDNRWLLFARGPSWGPAVLFWGYLLFSLVVALALGLVAESPLGVGAWLLLALGLTQASAVGGLVVAGLFLVLAWRARRPRGTAVGHDALQVLLVVWVLVALGVLYGVIEQGLSLRPDMQVAGASSSNTVLRWYSDRVEKTTPAAGVVSLPLWVYRGLMLAWALWLAASLVRWAGWGWRAMNEGGLWRSLRKEEPSPVPPAAS